MNQQICPVHSETTRQIEKQAERTDSLFVDVASAQTAVARVEQKTTELRHDHDDLVEKVDIIDDGQADAVAEMHRKALRDFRNNEGCRHGYTCKIEETRSWV